MPAVRALVTCHEEPPARRLLERVLRQVDGALIVADGLPAAHLPALEGLAGAGAVEVLALPRNGGKGSALAAGIEALLAVEDPPEAVVVIDGDGQHPPEAIPRFVAAAAAADLVIGDRFGDLSAMPWERRLSNRLARLLLAARFGARLDTQCGMRLLRGRALREIAVPGGGYEAETRHLIGCLRAGVPVAAVPIPALYAGERSSFRRLRDTWRVLRALLAPASGGGPPSSPVRAASESTSTPAT